MADDHGNGACDSGADAGAGGGGAGGGGAADGDRILVHAPSGRDGPMVCQVLRRAGFASVECHSVEELCRGWESGAGAALVAEEALSEPAIECLQEALRKQPPWSDLPLIVMTGGGKTTRFSERVVRRLGGVANLTLLERPLRILTLVSAANAALQGRRRQYQVGRLLAEAQDAVRQRDQFLAMLGHELRNPLAAIRTSVEVLKQGGLEDGELGQEHCRIISRQVRNLSRLVDDLLDVARVTSGKIVLERKRVDLCEVARQSLEAVKLAQGAQRHEILFDACAAPAAVIADPVRMEQVVTNLVANAVKYTPAGGRIRLTVERERGQDTAGAGQGATGQVVVRVKDTGDGIPPDVLPHVFEPFVQAKQNLARSRGGLGLGLPVVRTLVEMHGGAVSVTSPGVGQGSEFVVCLPAAPDLPGAGAAAARAITPAAGGAAGGKRPAPRRVLLIEDNADSRTAMRALLRLWGHQSAVAEDGRSGVAAAVADPPDVALVDIGLPDLDGYEVARRIRAALGDRVHLVALTGYGQPEDRRRAEEAGFNRHLVKPVDPDLLDAVLADLTPSAAPGTPGRPAAEDA